MKKFINKIAHTAKSAVTRVKTAAANSMSAVLAFNRRASEKTEIVRVTMDIKEGDEITAEMVQTVEVGAYNLPQNLMTDKKEVVGKYATADLAAGDYILSSKLSAVPAAENAYLYNLDGTKQAISVTIKSFAVGLSGKLESGDIVTVIVADYQGKGETAIPPELQYTDADGNLIRLTCDDFACAAEFRRWKDWSDSDLRKEENADHKQSDNSISLEVLSEEATAVESIEDEYMEQISADEAAVLVRLLRQGLSSHLTETQRRRLWKYCVEGKPVRLIAKEEFDTSKSAERGEHN